MIFFGFQTQTLNMQWFLAETFFKSHSDWSHSYFTALCAFIFCIKGADIHIPETMCQSVSNILVGEMDSAGLTFECVLLQITSFHCLRNSTIICFVFQIFVAQWEWRSNKCAGQGVTRDCAEDGSSWGAESGRGGREWEHPWRGRHHPSTPIPALHGGARSGGCARPRPARLAERCPRISGAGSGVSAAVPAPVIQWYDSTHGHTAAHRTAGTIGDFSQGYVTRTSWNQGWTVWDYFTVNGRVFPTKCWSYPS